VTVGKSLTGENRTTAQDVPQKILRMKQGNFLIAYTWYDIHGSFGDKGKIKVKNKPSEFVAKCSLENFLKRKNPSFGRLEIHSCREYIATIFGDIPLS